MKKVINDIVNELDKIISFSEDKINGINIESNVEVLLKNFQAFFHIKPL